MILNTPKEPNENLLPQIEPITEQLKNDNFETHSKFSFKSFTSFTRKERIAILIAVLSQLMWALNIVVVKTGSKCDSFNSNNYSMWRSVGMTIITYCKIKKEGTPVPKFSEIKSKGWFLLRTFGNYFCYCSLILAVVYLRAATASCLAASSPFVIIVLSIWLLKEKFYLRYPVGIIICFMGSAIILLNEKHGGAQSVGANANIPLGLFFVSCHILLIGSSIFAQKIIVGDGIVTDVQVLYTGIYNFLTAFVVCFWDMNFGLNLKLIFICLINAVIFYYGQFFTDMSLKRMDASKYAPSSYIQTLFVFILSLILFGESFYFTDMIGSFLIISFHLYNAYDPIKPNS